jgi:hypothetical protein
MNNSEYTYTTETVQAQYEILQFLFVSASQEKAIVKVVQYQYVTNFEGRRLFNLGFGDFDMTTGLVSDEAVSGNKDHYRVFNTVLSTIPRFFDAYGDVILMAQGSDSKKEYIEQCRATCSKKCGPDDCKNSHRRINVYRGFVDKHFERLSAQYTFRGGEGIENQSLIEPYQIGKKYTAVLVMRKNS